MIEAQWIGHKYRASYPDEPGRKRWPIRSDGLGNSLTGFHLGEVDRRKALQMVDLQFGKAGSSSPSSTLFNVERNNISRKKVSSHHQRPHRRAE
jgi:hypothetical protein